MIILNQNVKNLKLMNTVVKHCVAMTRCLIFRLWNSFMNGVCCESIIIISVWYSSWMSQTNLRLISDSSSPRQSRGWLGNQEMWAMTLEHWWSTVKLNHTKNILFISFLHMGKVTRHPTSGLKRKQGICIFVSLSPSSFLPPLISSIYTSCFLTLILSLFSQMLSFATSSVIYRLFFVPFQALVCGRVCVCVL